VAFVLLIGNAITLPVSRSRIPNTGDSVKHLALYVNEFTFRLNDGNVKINLMDRISSMICGTMGKRLTYKELIK
jgi:hypothetical protein